MTLERADCRRMLGDSPTLNLELTTMADKAAVRGDAAARSMLLSFLAFTLRSSDDLGHALQVGHDALTAAEQVDNPFLKADALLSLGLIFQEQGDLETAQDYLDGAQPLITEDDWLMHIKAHFLRMGLHRRSGQHQDSIQVSKQGLQLARAMGSRDWEGLFLNGQAASTNDLSIKQSLYERALTAFEASGNRLYQAVVLMNKSSILIELGLYQRALETAHQALNMTQAMNQDGFSVYCLQFLSIASYSNGDLLQQIVILTRVLKLAQKIGHTVMEFVMWSLKGLNWLLRGEPVAALEALQKAGDIKWKRHPNTTANLLAYQAAAHRSAGDLTTAYQIADQVVKILDESVDESNRDLFIEEVCWWCYVAQAPEPGEPLTPQAWHTLELGMKTLFAPIETLSDAGLRRGYLHRVHFRRLLILEWLRHAAAQGVETEKMTAFTAQVHKAGRLDEVFRRLLAIGVRLNAQRDPALLPDVIVQEVSELLGAERIALLLPQPDGSWQPAAMLLPKHCLSEYESVSRTLTRATVLPG
jgi:tetratricopeptide (TPR) repeat protein